MFRQREENIAVSSSGKAKIIFDNVSVFRVLYSITDGGAS